MKLIYSLGWLGVLVLFSACATFRVGTEFASGREAMFAGNYETALGYFQSVAQQDPDYAYGGVLRQGIWSYVGRTQYLTGKWAEAQQTLEKALTQDKGKELINLYLGLTLINLGNRQKGLEDLEAGMKGVAQFINYITEVFRYNIGAFWDPGYAIRKAVAAALTMASGENIDWQRLIAEGEWIGMNFEREPDLANAQRFQQLQAPTQ
jgi:tetratricopeptide (TPR) repeat protein